VNYLRGVSAASGGLTAHGWVTKPGRRVAFVDGDLRDGSGTLVATATGSCLIIGA
jgi:acyl-coenzyme A thioesterase PaaI-like protein